MRTMTTRLGFVLVLSLLLSSFATAQSIPFTGFVDQDFAGMTYVTDEQGLDVQMSGPFNGSTSGWDMLGLAMHYDKANDRLQVGVDTHGICGDADGNGNPSQTDYYLYLSGGVDQPNMSGGEVMAVCFDFNDDGIGDVIAGIPVGASTSQFTVAKVLPGSSLSSSFLAFGTDMPEHNGGILGSPVATCPDMEFSLTNFCSLMGDYGYVGQTHIGVHVYLGSLDDAMIPSDYISGTTIDEFRRVEISQVSGGLPILNHLTMIDIELDNGAWKYTGGYTKAGGFIACLIFSLIDNPEGTYLPAPYDITILVGDGTMGSVVMEEFNAPITEADCEYFEDFYHGPLGLENMTFYVQAFMFRSQFDPTADRNFYASNRVIVGPDSYPTFSTQ